ncbi:aminotransferase class V-fold PLP-dependent enzyme [Nocardia sp. CDC159]|uniref:Aminotransferase class V-fold PLP-dependent enzyme n=1 Tax=Nocardia pulmonis TaxID=2951408 RepID=A0A9X2J314_9NOCA|nr:MULTISPECIES: aminotransferase class V-fold PLP-dependent enzyme [Nocardia]MCM6778616.1 aminotransferase class V-fold PLP-dependent enzyme [Nocardia pulmonis]MCM6791505.1 aminotransferase class V-fold PLP-dependent enzyme [Nocardia sp. CDC159]
MDPLAPGEFRPETTYLNTAAFGLPAASRLAAERAVTERWTAGHIAPSAADDRVEVLRASFVRLLAGATADDIAIGHSVGSLIGPAAAALPSGAEVLVAEGDFASVPNPFRYRGDLMVRTVPLERLAQEVRPQTALVAVSVVQSADGRAIDPAELRAATRAHDAWLLLDATQAAGWLPLRFDDADFWVAATFKWLLGARSVSCLAVHPTVAEAARPVSPGWYAAADRWAEMYGPQRLSPSARRFDDTPDWLGVVGAVAGLELIEKLGVEAIGRHDRALAAEFRCGLADLGLRPVPGDSPIVTVPGAGERVHRLAESGIITTARAGGLRVSFHVHNGSDDVERALKALAQR